jgi:hypothetical protein
VHPSVRPIARRRRQTRHAEEAASVDAPGHHSPSVGVVSLVSKSCARRRSCQLRTTSRARARAMNDRSLTAHTIGHQPNCQPNRPYTMTDSSSTAARAVNDKRDGILAAALGSSPGRGCTTLPSTSSRAKLVSPPGRSTGTSRARRR